MQSDITNFEKEPEEDEEEKVDTSQDEPSLNQQDEYDVGKVELE